MRGGSPLFWSDVVFSSVSGVFYLSGRYTGEERFLYSRSPLCLFVCLIFLIGDVQDVGEIYRRGVNLYSRSPLSEPDFCLL